MNDHNPAKMQFALKYPLQVRSLPPKGLKIFLDAREKECVELARNHDLLQVKSCFAEYQLLPWKRRGVRLKGTLKAEITQACVVSLEPIENQISEDVEVVFLPEDSKLVKPGYHEDIGELLIDAEGSDMPEVFDGDSIDIGAITEEFFELAIDPYPRKVSVLLEQTVIDNNEIKDEKPSPFAILKQLK